MSTTTTMIQTVVPRVQTIVSPISPLVAKMKQQFLSLDIPLPSVATINGTGNGQYFESQAHEFEPQPYPMADEDPEVTCWFLDTREIWPGDNIATATGASKAMSLITLSEQNAILSKMFVSDARMSLGSALLKRAFISKVLGIAWKDVKLARKGNEKHGKPCAVDEYGRPIQGIDFNVSHQNGLVALIGWDGRKQHRYSPNGQIQGVLSPGECQDDVMVGVDIVCVNERETAQQTIDEEGFDGWVDIYDAVFSDEERWSMKYDVDYVTMLDGSHLTAHDIGRNDRCIQRNKSLSCITKTGRDVNFSSELLIDAKLRRFYTYFCYKEAYIKLAGEALLAPWLKQLEFFNVRSPKPGVVARCSQHGTWGEEVEDVEVKMHGRVVRDVKMKIQAFEETYMLSTAIQGSVEDIAIPAFKKVHIDKDILTYAGFLSEDNRKDSAMSVPDLAKMPEAQAATTDTLLSPWENRYWND